MKIILEGLKMKSEVIDCPDNIGHEYKVAIYEPLQVAIPKEGIPPFEPFATLCVFTYTGRHSPEPINILNLNGDVIFTEHPKIYRLTDIRKG